VIVSERVGTIKPHPAIFRAAEAALGMAATDGPAILHVGDDWAADVVGAKGAGWRAAYLRRRPDDSPLPASEPGDGVVADLELDTIDQLEAAVAS
jgi:putative hydrolase of the HAD superfamily